MIANNSIVLQHFSASHIIFCITTSGTEFVMAAFQEHFPKLNNQYPHTHRGYVQNSTLAYYSHYFCSMYTVHSK